MERQRCPYCGEENVAGATTCAHCKRMPDNCPTVAVLDFFTAVQAGLSDKYELVAEIGQGGNASVYQAIQKNLDRKVAIKVLLPHLVNDRDYLERFHLEARAIAKLRHPHIVTIYDEGSENGVHYMAMEFLEGKDLHHLVKEKGRLSVNEAIGMARCIAGALDFAHSYGIVHRDVKSSNIIMTSGRTAVLMDFGIAQAGYSQLQTRVGTVLGTPEFMSPEQAGGKAVDSRSDIYSLGVVLYHTLSGRHPFKADNPISTIHKILYEDPVPIGKLVKLPPSVEHAIDRCLEKDPAKRVGNGKELIELLSVKSPQRPAVSGIAARAKIRMARRPFMRIAFSLTVVCALIAGYSAWHRFAVADVPSRKAGMSHVADPAMNEVPNLVGRTGEEAMIFLRRSGFQVGRVGIVSVSEPTASGKVESQRPMQGTKATPGSVIHLLIASPLPDVETPVRSWRSRQAGVTASYTPIEIDPFDGFPSTISLGILDFTGPGGKPTDLSVRLYDALRRARHSFRIFPFPSLKAEQNGLGLASFNPLGKEVLSAMRDELSLDFVVTGIATDDADSSFTLQMIRCAGGITVFSKQFRNSSTSRALDDAVQFLVKRQVPTYTNR